jgi:hypothetical protein
MCYLRINPTFLLYEKLVVSLLLNFSCCSALEPSSLQRAIYPVLTSYSTPDKQAYPRHSLSRAALITSDSPIFFLDAFTTLIVFYSSTADPALPFPPPQDCKLFLSSRSAFMQEKLFFNEYP